MKTPHAAVAIATALVVGVASGAAAASDPVTKAPYQCRVMANLAGDTFAVYEKQVISVHNAATRGRSEFARHEADVKRQWAQIDDTTAKYEVAKAACLGGAR